MKDILLISYTFPPYPGIGGRRWAKFAKYLTKLGYTVHVVCAKNPLKTSSFYINDVLLENIKVYSFESMFPRVLLNPKPQTLFEKLRYKFWMLVLPVFVKGYIFDKAIFDEKKIFSLSKKIITDNNIKNVIVTGAPFRINYYSLKLKEFFPDINLIQDFRDPWTWGKQYSALTIEAKDFETKMLTKVVEAADVITVPVMPMKDYLCKNYSSLSKKIHVLPHAFDADEITVKSDFRENSFKCAFFGTIYSDIENYFDKLTKLIHNESGKMTLDIFSDSFKYQEIVKKNNANDWIQYKKTLVGKTLFDTLSNYDYVVFIYPSYVKDFISTKFYEIISSKIPIIYIGEDGVASNFISNNNIGIHVNESTIDSKLKDFINGKLNWHYNHNYSVEEYSFYNVSNQVSNFFV